MRFKQIYNNEKIYLIIRIVFIINIYTYKTLFNNNNIIKAKKELKFL